MVKLNRLVGLGLCLASGWAFAASPTVVESFNCTYVEGKGRPDLDAAISSWSRNMAAINNADLNQYRVFLLTPVRATTEVDFIWLGVSPNLAIWGNGLDAYTSSPEGAAADATFAEVIDCESGLWFSEQVYGGQSG